MLRRVALVRTNVSEELSASFIRATRIGELGTTLAVTSNRRTLRRNTHLVFLRSVRRLLVRKLEKRPLGRLRRKWIDNIKMGLLDIGLSVVDWIGLTQDRYRWRDLVNAVMNPRVP
jgi:hypothetical protein